tara:strand:+ start:795 stop:1040 length:246 start_codon:yes stop_codon:yes gene_type:complete
MPSHYQTRRNRNCPDGMEHQMPNGRWMCGKTHNNTMEGGNPWRQQLNLMYNTEEYGANPYRKGGSVNNGSHNFNQGKRNRK